MNFPFINKGAKVKTRVVHELFRVSFGLNSNLTCLSWVEENETCYLPPVITGWVELAWAEDWPVRSKPMKEQWWAMSFRSSLNLSRGKKNAVGFKLKRSKHCLIWEEESQMLPNLSGFKQNIARFKWRRAKCGQIRVEKSMIIARSW